MEDSDDKLSVWQLFMVALSVLAIALLAFQTFAKPTGDLAQHLFFLDDILCAFFFGDFLWQLYRARRRMNYLKWGWLDLLSSNPRAIILRSNFRVSCTHKCIFVSS